MLSEIALVFLLSLCNGFFALSEMALVASRKSRLKQQARKNRHARAALRYTEAPEHFLSTVQVGITVVMLITGAVAGNVLGKDIASLLQGHSLSWLAPYARGFGVVFGFILISFIQIVVGELLPKRLALSAPERVLALVAEPMYALSRLSAPFVWLLNVSSSALLRLLRIRSKSRDAMTEEEIRLIVAESTEQGVLDTDEQAMMNRVLRLGDRTVNSVMVPRNQITWLDISAPRSQNIHTMRTTPFSRYPVYRGDESDMLGILEVKSLLGSIDQASPDLFQTLAQPLYVPATVRALDLLETFRDAKVPMALVVDEYGDIEGLVTLNNLLGAVVGASRLVRDRGKGEHDESSPIIKRADGSYVVDGLLSIDDLRELLHADLLPGEKEFDFHTVAGMIMTALGHVPQVGEIYEWQNIRFDVIDLDGPRINKLLVTPANSLSTRPMPTEPKKNP